MAFEMKKALKTLLDDVKHDETNALAYEGPVDPVA
jgi:hypothetical protein